MNEERLHYLELLSKDFPTQTSAAEEIIRLKAINQLPKGTEFFCTDIHGEYEGFSHIIRNGSGTIRAKIDNLFADEMTESERRTFATLVYYPNQKMNLLLPQIEDKPSWFHANILRAVRLCNVMARKYTRLRTQWVYPEDYALVVDELLTEYEHNPDKQEYYDAIIDTAIEIGSAQELLAALCHLIQRLAIDRLHIIGDIYDRGPYPDKIMDMLMKYQFIDIQWGNHDMTWIGASVGQPALVATVVRICARYDNLSILSDTYGINILPLVIFAQQAYADDPCAGFALRVSPDADEAEIRLMEKIQKAIAVIQFKVEAKLIDENPGFNLQDRKLFHKIDFEAGTIEIDGETYELKDNVFPTVNPHDPYRLTDEEQAVIDSLCISFKNSYRLREHMNYLLDVGGLYTVYNGNLMLHACVPLNPDGSLMETEIFGKSYKGKALYDVMENYVRDAFYAPTEEERKRGADVIWYLWLGKGSPLFAKSKMATFEMYFVADKSTHKEIKNTFYSLDDEHALDVIFEDFGLDPRTAHMICGHVPVKVKDGEDPVKCGGRLLMIDGGFSKAYQPTTGIAGYTLISNSYGFVLAAHEPLESIQVAVEQEIDIHSTRRIVETAKNRIRIKDVDKGIALKRRVEDLEALLCAYKEGLIDEGDPDPNSFMRK